MYETLFSEMKKCALPAGAAVWNEQLTVNGAAAFTPAGNTSSSSCPDPACEASTWKESITLRWPLPSKAAVLGRPVTTTPLIVRLKTYVTGWFAGPEIVPANRSVAGHAPLKGEFCAAKVTLIGERATATASSKANNVSAILRRQQRSECCQIPPVGLVLDLFRRLQQLRDSAESLVIEQKRESVESDLAVADVLMTIHA